MIGQGDMDTILLDIHCHLVPLKDDDVAGVTGVEWTADGALRVDGYTLGSPAVYRPDELVGWMDRNGVERAWISIPPPLYRHQLGRDAASIWAAICNGALERAAAARPDRLTPLFHLPVRHPRAAARIVADRAKRGAPLFAMPAGWADGGVMLSAPEYEELWRALDDAGGFLFLHPSRGCDPRYDAFYLQNLLGSPVETALAAAHLSMSGIIEAHPNAHFCLAHGGGATAAVAGRLERGQLTERPGSATGAGRPREVLRRVSVDCICHDPHALELSAAIHGEDKVLFGSDWPFAMGLPDPRDQLSGVRAELLEKIFRANPAALLARYARED